MLLYTKTMEKVNTIKKLLLLNLSICLMSCTSTNWDRLENASSISVIGYSDNRTLVTFDNKGNGGSIDDAINSPILNNKFNQSFKFVLIPVINKIMLSSKFSVTPHPIYSSINFETLEDPYQLNKLTDIDILVNVINIFGVVNVITKTDNSQRLALKTILQFADKNGFIGSRTYFTTGSNTQQRKSTSSFSKNDYKSIERALIKKIKTDINALKGIQKKKSKKHT